MELLCNILITISTTNKKTNLELVVSNTSNRHIPLRVLSTRSIIHETKINANIFLQ